MKVPQLFPFSFSSSDKEKRKKKRKVRANDFCDCAGRWRLYSHILGKCLCYIFFFFLLRMQNVALSGFLSGGFGGWGDALRTPLSLFPFPF